tara:strand:+ start:2368 stop:3057 length:690 start_codon:yes stop_codon:yes gene_type:complete
MINGGIINTVAAENCTTNNSSFPVTNLAYYKLDGNTTDSAGTNNGTWTGTQSYGVGEFDNAASFNGSSYIQTNTSLPNSANFTVSMWVKKNADVTAFFAGTMSSGVSNGLQFSWNWGNFSNANKIIFSQRDSNGNGATIISSTAYNNSQVGFLHIVGIRNGSTNYLYVNGTAQGSVSNYSTLNHSVGFTIGRSGAYTGSPLNGLVDQVRIFNTAITASQVVELYQEVQC